jgi:hypothetical protein
LRQPGTIHWIICSLLLHAGALVLFEERPTIRSKENIQPVTVPIKLSLKHLSKFETTRQLRASLKSSAADTDKDLERAGNSARFRHPPKSYSSLLPKVEIVFPQEGFNKRRKSKDFDPENEGIPYAERMANILELDIFAKDVAQRISIPESLRQLEPQGHAFARFSKQGSWKPTHAKGDPYYRALLYQVLKQFNANDHAIQMLERSSYDSVRIYLEHLTVFSKDPATEPLQIVVDGNKIFITFTHQLTDPKWQAFMASRDKEGNANVGVNIIGIGKLLYDALNPADPLLDKDLRRLRTSPAFVKPFGD